MLDQNVHVSLLTAVALLISPASFAAERSHHFNNAHEALSAARGSTPLEALSICEELPSLAIVTEEDLRALYAELLDPKICAKQEPVSQAMGKCVDARHHDQIAAWIAKEKTLFTDKGTSGAYNAKSARKLAVREQRLLGLLTAAGKGRNTRALPILRAMLKKGGAYSGPVAIAIGRIGDPEDLEDFIAADKRARGVKYDLSGFGVMAIDRIMKDVDDPTVPLKEKEAIIGYLSSALGHETLTRYQLLMHHQNRFVSKAAAEAIARLAEPADEPLIRRMLKDEDPLYRREALTAMRNIWDDKYTPAVVSALKLDPEEAVRATAAECLGARQVCASAPALRTALNDVSSAVRDAARRNLQALYNRETEPLPRRPHPGWTLVKVEQMLTEAQGKKKEWQKFAALAALARSGYPDETVPALADIAANGADPINRAGAVQLLLQIGGDNAKAELTKDLASTDPWLRKNAAAALTDWIGECDGKPETSP